MDDKLRQDILERITSEDMVCDRCYRRVYTMNLRALKKQLCIPCYVIFLGLPVTVDPNAGTLLSGQSCD